MNPTVCIFPKLTDQFNVLHLPMDRILAGIRKPSALVQSIIVRLRAEPDKEKRRPIKSQLPAICWGADLTTRSADVPPEEKELSRSGLICLDIDHVADIPTARAKLQGDPHVAAVWLSPSGDGLKVLVPIAGTLEAHWRALDHHVTSTHGLACDGARKDVYGLCFVSHDPDLWVAPALDLVEPFSGIMEEAPPVRGFTASSSTFRHSDGEVLEDFRQYNQAEAPLQHVSPDIDYHEWIKIGQAIHCQFNGSAEGLVLWDAWSASGKAYQGSDDLHKHYRSFRSSGISFRTVLRKAMDAGWKRPRTAPPSAPYQERITKPLGTLRQHFDQIINGEIKSIPWPWPLLDKFTQCLGPGTVTLLVGTPGSTKSWVTLQSAIMWQRNGTPFALLELEQDHIFWAKRVLVQLARNGGLSQYQWVTEHPDEARDLVSRHEAEMEAVMKSVTTGNSFTCKQIVEWAEEQGKKGVRVAVIDPLTAMDDDGFKPHEAARKVMSQLTAVVQKYKMSLVLVTHNGSLAGHRGEPGLDQVAGGKGFTRFADSVLWLSPVMDGDDTKVIVRIPAGTRRAESNRHLRVLKSRSGAGVGQVICLQFDNETTIIEQVGVLSHDKEPTLPDMDNEVVRDRLARSSAAPSDLENTF